MTNDQEEGEEVKPQSPHQLEYQPRRPCRRWPAIDIDPKSMRQFVFVSVFYLLFLILFFWLL
jgi:hypothetical protein